MAPSLLCTFQQLACRFVCGVMIVGYSALITSASFSWARQKWIK